MTEKKREPVRKQKIGGTNEGTNVGDSKNLVRNVIPIKPPPPAPEKKK